MKHLFIRPESKPTGKLGRGQSVVLYDTVGNAAENIIFSLLSAYSHTADRIDVVHEAGSEEVKLVVYNEHDYYRWLDVVNKPVWLITLEHDYDFESTKVSGINGGYRYQREPLEKIGYKEECNSLSSFFNFNIVKHWELEELEEVLEPSVMLTEVINYGDTFDLPIGNSNRPTSWLGKVYHWLANSEAQGGYTTDLCRKPYIVFESRLGGNIAIYKSVSTGKEVDIAFFDRYGALVNVFSFQDGCPHHNGINGLTIEDLISISTWRILHLNLAIHADENISAARSLNTAIDALEARQQKRAREAMANKGE